MIKGRQHDKGQQHDNRSSISQKAEKGFKKQDSQKREKRHLT